MVAEARDGEEHQNRERWVVYYIILLILTTIFAVGLMAVLAFLIGTGGSG